MSNDYASRASEEKTSEGGVLACVMCKEAVKAGARRCPHCGSFQNWRRHLTFSSVVLSWAIALISLLTVVMALVTKIATPEEENIQLRLLEVNQAEDFILMWGSNAGKRPGVIRSVFFEIPGGNSTSDRKLELFVVREDAVQPKQDGVVVDAGPVVLEPGVSQRIRFYSYEEEMPELRLKPTGAGTHCKLIVEVLQFNGGIRTLEHEYRCHER